MKVPIVTHINNTTISLVFKDLAGEYRSYCSGSWINNKNIITARHCVENDDKTVDIGRIIIFQTHKEFNGKHPYSGSKKSYMARVVAVGKNDIDVAVLEAVKDMRHGIVKILPGEVPQGLKVYITGHPRGLTFTYMEGHVAAIREMTIDTGDGPEVNYVVHIIAPASLGSSGGAVLTENGELIAINTFIKHNLPGHIFSTHKDHVIQVLEENNIQYY